MSETEYTTIQVSRQTQERLNQRKVNPRHSYDAIIRELLNHMEAG